MQAPNISRGFLYPTHLKFKCPRYSQCLVTNKCQNYDKHCRLCALCETRVRPASNLGGCLPEGEFEPDVQVALKVIQNAVNAPFAHPDAEPGSCGGVTMEDYQKLEEAKEVLSGYSKITNTEEDVIASIDQNQYNQIQGLL